MEVAIIPPGSLMNRTVNRRYEMIIPDAIRHDSNYSAYYSRLGKIRNSPKYTILDNGSFESGAAVSDNRILEMAHVFRVTEVIAPDVLGDVYHSISRLETFLYTIDMIQDFRLRVMAAVQGQNLAECKLFVTYVAQTPRAGVTWTLGLPKHLIETTGHQDARLRLARWITREYDHLFEIHALGYNFPGEAQGLAELGVRSIDTSAPFIAAYNGRLLSDLTDGAGPRPDGFWNLPADKFDTGLVDANIQILDAWAQS